MCGVIFFLPYEGKAQQPRLSGKDHPIIKEEYSVEHWQKALAEERAAQERWKNNPEPYRGPGRAADYSDPFEGGAILIALFSILILSGIFLGIYRFILHRNEKLCEVWLIGVLLFSAAVGLQRIIMYFQFELEGTLSLLTGWPLIFFIPQALLFKWIALRRPFVLSALMGLVWMTPVILFIIYVFIENSLRG